MSAANSPTYQLGLIDGQADAEAYGACPPREIVGPNPPIPAYPTMYMRGYNDAYGQRSRCQCAGHGRHASLVKIWTEGEMWQG